MKSRLLTKIDYRGNQVCYFPVPDIARKAGFGPYLDYIGPYTSEGEARRDEERMIREASLIILRPRSNSSTTWNAKDGRAKRRGFKLEGYEAHKTGAGVETCPYPHTERTGYYWLLGWWERERKINPDSLPSEMLNSPRGKVRRQRLGNRHRGQPDAMTASNDTGGVKTKLYFSAGPTPSAAEMQALQEAGVDHLLVFHPPSCEIEGWVGAHKILCSQSLGHLPSDHELETYLGFVEAEQDEFDFALAYEVPGDADATRTTWLKTVAWLTATLGDTPIEGWPQIIPIWSWGSSLDLLDQYLQESHLVAIGGNLNPLLLGQDRGVFQDLIALCYQYKGRFHIRQCGWASAIEQLLGLAHSIDTSLWMQGYQGTSIFQDAKTGLLHLAPAAINPEDRGLSRHALCVRNAQNLKSLADDPCNLVVSLTKCSVCGGTFNSKSTDRKYCTSPVCGKIYNKHL